jgi:predicted nucleic acid-binding protein
VIDEVRAGNEDPDFLDVIEKQLDVIGVDGDPDDEILDSVDYGEAYALSAASVEDGTLATDDLAAREIADERGIPVTGSIGLLIRLVRRDAFTVDEADAVLERWIEASRYFSPVESVRELLPDDQG